MFLFAKEFFFSILLMLSLILLVAYFTLLERKVMSAMQARNGPDKVGIFGLLQPISDAVKLLIKKFIFPQNTNAVLFFFAPYLTILLSILSTLFLPFSPNGAVILSQFSLLWVFALSSLNIYSIFISGYVSRSNYALIGSVRSVLQMVSYELVLSLLILPVIYVSGSANISHIAIHQIINNFSNFSWMLPNAFLFFICILAETNRAPFDLPEAEAELVAGYNVEYSSLPFAFFFLGEYLNIFIMSFLFVFLFWSGWGVTADQFTFLHFIIMFTKVSAVVFSIIWVRATLPRVRYDSLMNFCWKYLLLFSTGFFIFFVVLHASSIFYVI